MDIGVPSLRNLQYINGWRRAAWAFSSLEFASHPSSLQLRVFQSLTSFEYTVAVVKDSFINGSSWDLATAEQNRGSDPG